MGRNSAGRHLVARTPEPHATLRHPLFILEGMETAFDITHSDSCDCDVDAAHTGTASFSVSPASGGGWTAWTAALVRMFTRLRDQPAHCVVVTQEPNERYVQVMIGHGHAHVEASSNTYLAGDFRLGPSEEQLLRSFGFEHPDAADPRSTLPQNWWFDEEHADPHSIAETLTATMIGVMCFDERWPITIDIFGADSPCAACFWETS
jgi:hypothetical protein